MFDNIPFKVQGEERFDFFIFAHDIYWWRSDVFWGAFENPKDNGKIWKEITVKLPNSSFLYSYKISGPLGKVSAEAQAALTLVIQETFPELLEEKKLTWSLCSQDSLVLSFEDAVEREKLTFSFASLTPFDSVDRKG